MENSQSVIISDVYLSAVTWIEKGEYARALRMIDEVLESGHKGVDKDVIQNAIGAIHMKMKNYAEATKYFFSAISIRPMEQYYCNAAQSLMMEYKPQAALNTCRVGLNLFRTEKPNQLYLRAHAAAHMTKNFLLADEMLSCADESEEVNALTGMRMMAGRKLWDEGVEMYGARKVMYEPFIPRSVRGRFLSSCSDIIKSGKVNVILEQGLGDCIMMIPYILRLAKDYNIQTCVISLDGRHDYFVDDIMSSYDSIITKKIDADQLCAENGNLVWMFDLLGMANGPIKSEAYIHVSQQVKDLANWASGKIGICWRGNPNHNNDRQRSMSLSDLDPILDMPNVISIQHDLTDEEKAKLFSRGIRAWDRKGLVSLAAVVSNLKAVVTVDTAMSHIAGATGTRCFTMLPTNADWRWGDFDLFGKSGFYSDNHVAIRQTEAGRWNEVIESVKVDLRNI